jgi:hypothetical protein
MPGRLARAEIEAATMQRTHEGLLTEDPLGKRTASMWALTLGCKNRTVATPENSNGSSAYGEQSPLAQWNKVNAAKVCHDRRRHRWFQHRDSAGKAFANRAVLDFERVGRKPLRRKITKLFALSKTSYNVVRTTSYRGENAGWS